MLPLKYLDYFTEPRQHRPYRRFIVDGLFVTAGLALCLLLMLFIAVQFDQWVLRWRSERLFSEMETILPYQSTWADAQRLMHRWGAFGHWDGSCTAARCDYEIRLTSVTFYNPHTMLPIGLGWLFQHDRLNLYEWLGGRGAGSLASFKVRDGIIWKKNVAIGLGIPIKIRKEGEFEATFFINVSKIEEPYEMTSEYGVLSNEAELDKYPYYKVQSPGGCMINCQIRTVYYSTHTPPEVIKMLTSFDFSCFTRFKPCTEFAQLLPTVRNWNP